MGRVGVVGVVEVEVDDGDVLARRGFLGFLDELPPPLLPMDNEEIEIEIVSKLGSVPVCMEVFCSVGSSLDILFF